MKNSSFSPNISIKSIKKFIDNDGNVTTRIRSPDETLKQISSVCDTIGVTRIADITYMDKLFIPNYSAFLPGTEDTIWVYGGKGHTKISAKTSALMESIERFCSFPRNNCKTIIRGTYYELSRTYNKVLHADEVIEPVLDSYNDKNSIVDYLSGFDILNNIEVLVPAQLVFSRYFPKSSAYIFPYSHTNGLASGNVIEEAICHALLEVIERDAASIADLCSSAIPYTLMKNRTPVNPDKSDRNSQIEKFTDRSGIYPDVDITSVTDNFDILKPLINRFSECGISLLVKDITQKDIGVSTFVASSVEWITADYGYFAKGYGAHLSAKVALMRAITELSQTRAANIQGARDDLRKIQYTPNDEIYMRKWQFMPSYCSRNKNNKNKVSFCDLTSYENEDISEDINLILNKLKQIGIKRVLIVNLTNPQIDIPVVRAIVPGLETFEVAKLFTQTELIMGDRAKSYFENLKNHDSQM
jgi:ribosomal protein S12 methylthiotransferase accessory factor